MRYLRVILPLLACSIMGAGCAASSTAGSGNALKTQAGPTAPCARYDSKMIGEMLGSGKLRLERDTTYNSWVLRDSAGIVMTGITLVEPLPTSPLDAKYGDCLAK